jgi:hypothetical protein
MTSLLAKQPVLVLLQTQRQYGAAFQPPRVLEGSCSSLRRPGHSMWAGVKQQQLLQGHRSLTPASGPLRAYEGSSSKDPSLEDYVEVRIESVKVSQGVSIVYLRVVGSESVIPVHIGEAESTALLREINKQRQVGLAPGPGCPAAAGGSELGCCHCWHYGTPARVGGMRPCMPPLCCTCPSLACTASASTTVCISCYTSLQPARSAFGPDQCTPALWAPK